MPDPITCDTFDEQVDELVLDLLDPATRDNLLHHADSCARCRTELHSLAEVADILSTAAPECEPPVGFEARVLDAITGHRHLINVGRGAGGGAVRSRWVLATAAAAAALLVGALGVLVGRATDSEVQQVAADVSVASGSLIGTDGTDHGWVLLAGDGDTTTLTMNVNHLPAGTYRCVVQLADGSRRQVASWAVGDTGSGHWVLPLAAIGDAQRVTMVDESGDDVAAAELAVTQL